MKEQYWIIEDCSEGQCHGPFPTIAKAEDWLRTDCEQTFLDSDKSLREGDMEEWATPVFIVRTVKRVRPVPKVNVAVRLKEEKP